MSSAVKDKVTVPALRARKGSGAKIAVVTAYDATMARLLDAGGVDVLMVGDSLGMVVQGEPTTLSVTLDEMIYHTRLVSRAEPRAHVVADMPFMSFQVCVEDTLRAAGRLVKEGHAEAVKLEGGEVAVPHIRALTQAGIPVMGHIGLTPQSVHAFGGFKVQGKSEEDRLRLVRDAKAVERAGAYAIVLEAIPSDLARVITENVTIPTIGIGAGPDCDGQVLVCYDFLGMFRDLNPKFVKRYADVGAQIVDATQKFVAEVRSGVFPDEAHSFAPASPGKALRAEVTPPVHPSVSQGPSEDR